MSLEDRVRSSVDQALGALVKQVVEQADAEREAATRAAREAAWAEAEVMAHARVAEAEARWRASLADAIATARAQDREVALREIRRQVEAELEQKLVDGLGVAETRMKMALADSQARATEALKAAVSAARVGEREVEMAGVTRLLESIRGLDGATSLSEVLDALALAAAREAARAAVVVLRGDRIQGWRMAGFGPRDAQPKSIDLQLREAGVIGMAVGAARVVTTRDSQSAAAGPGFETLPADRMGLAVPVIVGGRVVAVVYADGVTLDGHERPVPSGWPEVIEVLTRHAGRCLEALTTQRAAPPRIHTGAPARTSGQSTASAPLPATAPVQAPASVANPQSAVSQITDAVADAARRTARLLISEIRLYHEPAVHEGRRERNLMARLAPEIETARQAYNEQVPAVVRSQTDFFQQELIRTLAGGDATLLGNMA